MAKRILIADDNPALVELIKSRLEANAYEVITANDGFYAVKKAHEEKPDLIILDIRMPVGTGVFVFERLKMSEQTKAVPVIIMTAYSGEGIRQKVLEMGARDFLAKPFKAEDLLVKVRAVLGD